MSHHDSIQNHQPTKVSLRTAPNFALKDLVGNNIPVPLSNELLITGQGTIVFEIPETSKKIKEASVLFETEEGSRIKFSIKEEGANFMYSEKNETSWKSLDLVNKGHEVITAVDHYNQGIDTNKDCRYWISIDSLNKRLRYGKGEMRISTLLLDYQYDIPLDLFNREEQEDKQKYQFINELKNFTFSEGIQPISLWKDPVTIEPPVLVVPTENYTMGMAAEGSATTPSSLSKECQVQYGNVASFELNTPDFPDFEQAIEYSIRTEGCIGHRILEYKRNNSPFESESESEAEYKELYLRVTLGTAQGESPGVPYVMEIWPVGCKSPVHQHGYTHATIKVLRGAIDVDLYRMLPDKNSVDFPLKSATFKRNEITYIMPEVNQFHMLKNDLDNKETCITIQCYSYSEDDDVHYKNFDFVEDDEVGHFDPISDYDFLAFKEKVKEEWNAFLETKFWMEK